VIGCTTLSEHLHLDRGRPRTVSLMAAWVACDGPGCDAILSVPGTDAGDVIDDAIEGGWDCGRDRDLCLECAG
jgi:hypothetical protein